MEKKHQTCEIDQAAREKMQFLVVSLSQAKKVLWFYYSFTLVFLEETGTIKLWASIQRIFPIQNLSITSATIVILKYMKVIL